MRFKSKVFLAPMAEVNDPAFRILCSKYGAGLTWTEMISSSALARNEKNKLFNVQKNENPIAVQLMGNNLEDISKAVKIVSKKADVVDFNMGCPIHKIVNSGCGAALLKDPEKVKQIVETLVSSTKKPVSVKIRSGWDDKSINILQIAKIIEDNGASMIIVHPKTRVQLKSGNPDWGLIKKVKEKLSIPVIGNGGINKPEDVKKMFSETECDYVMIARAASKNPYIFTQVKQYLKNGGYEKENPEKIVFDYLKLVKKYKPSLNYIKLHVTYFTKGLRGSNQFRTELSKIKSLDEIENKLNGFFK
ncbi:tRNA dihydrouridine synthase DusB [Candidatus Woesearchaeota archaeon]|nr:tRNA dihydrouridine synthase DusB [Candidatus Woesearchaeota archaeon]